MVITKKYHFCRVEHDAEEQAWIVCYDDNGRMGWEALDATTAAEAFHEIHDTLDVLNRMTERDKPHKRWAKEWAMAYRIQKCNARV